MARTDTLSHFLTDVADAIRTKSGSQGTIQASSFDTAISNIPSGGDTPEAEEKDVNFYDYDGKRVYSYTKAEFLALNEYPANPTHQGLTAQGWNWDYQDAVDYVTEYGILDVGQMYIPTDGSTRLIIDIPKERTNIVLNLAVRGTATIDWGDGSPIETITGTSDSTAISSPHTYTPGEQTIFIKAEENNYVYFYSDSVDNAIIDAGNYYVNYAILSCIKEINVGTNMFFKGYYPVGYIWNYKLSLPLSCQFIGCRYFIAGQKIIILPKNLSSLDQYTLRCIVYGYIPFNTKIIMNGNCSSSTFTYNNVLDVPTMQQRIILPEKITSIYNGIEARGVLSLVIPKTITSINQLYLGACKVLDFSHHESIPTLGSSSAFGSDFPSDCQIVVPDSLYEDWIATNNWTNYATQIISKSDFDNQ